MTTDNSNHRSLSPREIDVLQALATGKNETETANALDISPYTVSAHKQRIFLKLNVHSVTAATSLALREGIIV